MKCPSCHYVYAEEVKYNQLIVVKGDEKFIDIYTRTPMKMENPKESEYGDYQYQDKVEVFMVACPKCRTVLLNI